MGTAPSPPTLDALLEHRDFVQALARRLVFDEHRAEDVAQETWVAAIEHPPRTGKNPRAWLAAVVRNFARLLARGEARRIRREATAAKPEALPSAEEIVEREAARRRVVEAVRGLDEPYRSTVLHRYFEGLPPREIAKRSGIPVATVRTRLARALDRLRDRLDREHGGDRKAWCLALLALALAPSKASASGLGGVLSGVLAMKSSVKLAAAVAALVAVGVWFGVRPGGAVGSGDPRPPVAGSVASLPDPESTTPREPVGVPGEAAARTPLPSPDTDPGLGEAPRADPSPAPPPDPRAERLVRVAATFLTEEPDVVGMNEFLRSLAAVARVVTESVEKDREEEYAKGEIEFADSALRASFYIADGRYGVRLKDIPPGIPLFSLPAGAEPLFGSFDVSFTLYETDADRARLGVQYQPPHSRKTPPGWTLEKWRLGGYGVSIGLDGASVEPLEVRRIRGGWHWGPGIRTEFQRPVSDTSPYLSWSSLLQPYAPWR